VPPRQSSAGRRLGRSPSRPRQPSLLILQFDTERLRDDGLCLIDKARFVALLGAFNSGADVEVCATTDLRDLLDQLAALVKQERRFDVVVCIGHSNETGIKVASDKFVDWEAFAGYLKPFEPRRLLLIACRAGRWPAANVLFRKLPKLRRIFASPMNTSKNLGDLLLWAVPYLLEARSPRAKLVQYGQIAAAALTGGQIRQWIRTRDMDNPDGMLLDLGAQIAEPYLRQVSKTIRSIFR
jgi:hypothetical protein